MPKVSEAVDERGPRGLVATIEHEGEQARGAGEIAHEDVVAGAAGERGMEDARDLGPGLKPARRSRARSPRAASRRTAIVRSPRLPSHASSGLATWPSWKLVSRSLAKRPGAAVTLPSMTSEWPTTYLVQARIDKSTPCAIAGKNSGVAQVLSSNVTMPRAFAAAQIAGTSCTSKVRLPGLSISIGAGGVARTARRCRRRSAGRRSGS